MSHTLQLNHKAARDRFKDLVDRAPVGWVAELREPKRTGPQNDQLWAALTDISHQVRWHGVKLTAEDWKIMMMAALNREVRIVPNIDGNGFVNLSTSTSRLTKSQFSDLLELVFAFGARNGVVFHDTGESQGRNAA